MEDFKIIQPSTLLAPYIRYYWILKANGQADIARTVPTGMMSLIFHRGNQIFSVKENELHPRSFINGQENSYADLLYSGEINIISVVFQPAGLRAFFDLPVNLLNNLRVTADSLSDKELVNLEQSIAETEDDHICILRIEQFLGSRLRHIATHNRKRIEASLRLIHKGQTDLSTLAGAACLSNKQFTRIFSEYVGANPKEFSRMIRFQRALHQLETTPTIHFTQLAFDCGFYDQSHLIREFKALSGYTPAEYLVHCPPHSDYFS